MSDQQADNLSAQAAIERSLSLGDYAHQIIAEQYASILKPAKKVLADKDPEQLHHMRVGTRRLRTALQVFGNVVVLPKVAGEKQARDLARILGELRDLDVQIAALKQDYRPHLSKAEQKILDRTLDRLKKQRRHAFAQVEATLAGEDYQKFKAAYETWLLQPQYTPLAQLPLSLLLPDLLSPLLSNLLLHPGWLIPINQISSENSILLHELRKDCKRVRYQAEFFTTFYGESLQGWVKEVKALQDNLGQLHDAQGLAELLASTTSKKTKIPELQAILQQVQNQAMANWENVRQRYLDTNYRQYLRDVILHPTLPVTPNQEMTANGVGNEYSSVEAIERST